MSDVDLTAANPLHHRSGPTDAWSTINTRENCPGVMSPLGATLWLPLSDLSVYGAFHDLGVLRRSEVVVADRPSDATAAVFFGRYSANLDPFRKICDRIPGTSGAVFEKQIYGTVRDDAPDYTSRRRYPAIALKAPANIARLRRRILRMCRDVEEWWRFATSPAGMARPASEQFREASSKIEHACRLHIEGSFVAQGVFDALAGLAESVGRPGLHLELSTGYGGMVETTLVRDLDRLARDELSFEEFLAAYGFRCSGELEVSTPSWRERPETVQKIVAKYRNSPDRGDPAADAQRRTEARIAAERQLLAALPLLKRPATRLLLRLASTFTPLREESKAAVSQAFDGARAACHAYGRELVAAGAIDQEDDVFHLTVDEVRVPPPNARDLVLRRRELRAAYEKLDVPGYWVGDPEPVASDEPSGGRVDTVTGMAAAFGVAQGRARVMASPEDCEDLQPDEILVCRTTDPSWAAAFHLAAGAVIDVGSTSSHGAIVAREMGLPCVINTRNGTSLLRTGDLLRVDGSTGVVTVIEPAR